MPSTLVNAVSSGHVHLRTYPTHSYQFVSFQDHYQSKTSDPLVCLSCKLSSIFSTDRTYLFYDNFLLVENARHVFVLSFIGT